MKNEDILKLKTGDVVYVTLYETGENLEPKTKTPPVKCVVSVDTTNHDGVVGLTTVLVNINGSPIELVCYWRHAGLINLTKYKFHLTEYDAIVNYNEMIDTSYNLLEKHFNKLTKRFMKDKVAL